MWRGNAPGYKQSRQLKQEILHEEKLLQASTVCEGIHICMNEEIVTTSDTIIQQ